MAPLMDGSEVGRKGWVGWKKRRRSGIGDWSVNRRRKGGERGEDGREVSRLDVSGEVHEIGNKHAAKNSCFPPPLVPIPSAASGRADRCWWKRG